MAEQVQIHQPTPETDVLTSYFPLPGFGTVPINAFVHHSKQPLLVDTGGIFLKHDYLDAIRSRVPLDQLRWIWLTHADPDHIGALFDLLEAAPQATLVTSFLGLGKLGLTQAIPPERVYLINPGQELDIGDRKLLAVRPPVFDAPETTACFDTQSRTLFSSDSFGALLDAPVANARDLTSHNLSDGMTFWATLDAPWLSAISESAFDQSLSKIRALAPEWVMGSHLPPARDLVDTLIGNLRIARAAPPFVGPDQEQMKRILSAA